MEEQVQARRDPWGTKMTSLLQNILALNSFANTCFSIFLYYNHMTWPGFLEMGKAHYTLYILINIPVEQYNKLVPELQNIKPQNRRILCWGEK